MGQHVMAFATNLKVFVSLVVLTILTVYIAKFVDLGDFNLALAMAIASVKVTLVLLWFMHLKGDSNTYKVLILTSVGFLALMFGISFADLFYR